MSTSQAGVFNLQEFADAGTPLVLGRLYTYAYGTTTLKVAYTDADGLVPHTYTSDGAGGQYIALNSRGEIPAPLYLLEDGSYDLTLKRSDGSTVWTRRADGVAVASSVIFTQSGTGAVARTAQDKMRERYSLADYGVLPGASATGAAAKIIGILAAVAAIGGGVVEADAGTYNIDATVFWQNKVTLIGKGRFATTLKLANGANTHLSETTGYTANVGTNTNLDFIFGLRDLTLDGNRANNSSGDVLRVYARSFVISNVNVLNAAENGCQFEYGPGGEFVGGMEPLIQNVTVDTCGKHGVAWRGPHDSQIDKLVLIDCSQTTDNTWDGFSMSGTTGGLRASNIHPWKRLATTNRMRFGVLANGGRWNFCTFEGAYVALKLSGATTVANSSLFGARTDATLVVESSDCALIGCSLQDSANLGLNAVRIGVVAGGSGTKLNMKSCSFINYTAPLLNIQNSAGFINIEGRTFACSTPLYSGTVLNSDSFRFKGDGSPSQNYRHEPPVLEVYSAGGTVSGDATDMPGELCRITGTGTFRVSAFLPGRVIEVLNRSGSAVTVFPPNGNSFVNTAGASLANDQSITLAAAAGFHIVAINSSQAFVFFMALTPITSIAATPSYVGQVAVTGGLAYMAVATSSSADWKQITN